MKPAYARILLGLLLVLAGVLLLLQNLGVIEVAAGAFWAVLFTAGGLAFLALFIADGDRWWAAIPGFTLVALGAVIGLQSVAPRATATWGGTIFLGGIGLSFIAVYLARRDFWWAIIPTGVLLTLATVAGVNDIVGGRDTGAILFVGLAITFGIVYLLPHPGRRMTWALIPAVVFLILGLTTLAATQALLNFLWPVALILLGVYLVYRAFRPRRA